MIKVFGKEINDSLFLLGSNNRCMASDYPTIRDATERDWDQISRLSAISGYEDYINEMGISFLKQGIILIAENPDPVGFMKITPLPDGFAWFSAIRVHPDFRRMGIGHRLMNEAFSRSKRIGSKGCRLMIENSNFKSKGLATKNGFSVVLDLLLFEGGFEISGLKCEVPRGDEYISMGWEFCRYVPELSENLCKYTVGGSSIYHYSTPRGSYQMITDPIDGKITHDVLYTSIPYQSIPDTFKLKPVEGFRRSQVFEIKF